MNTAQVVKPAQERARATGGMIPAEAALEGAELIGLSGNYCTDKKPAAVDGSSAAARSAKIDRAYRRGLPGVGQLDRGAGQARRGGGGHPCKGGA